MEFLNRKSLTLLGRRIRIGVCTIIQQKEVRPLKKFSVLKKFSPVVAITVITFGLVPFVVSCGKTEQAAKKETIVAEEPAAEPEAKEEAGEPAGKESKSDEPVSELAVTEVRKEKGGKYSATLNRAIVFKGLEIREEDGRELLFFPKSPGKGGREYNIVFLEDKSIAKQIKDAIKDGRAKGRAEPGSLKVTEVRWKELDGHSKVKGFADVTLNNAVTIKGCKLIDGKDGIWMAWPSVKKGDEYEDLVFAVDKGVREMVEKAVKRESGL
ncbi:MAG: hypothetical protein A3G34_06530 [Candidatus Lindowbacteria bacterium RIFCSPLOWO2_12_FULL_62_27]|nr:MAG: hypothetical protein A3G34_06530 [Candidatus Lindowbacteria bacterium RIFCSPLOWO2_12_FULL_62_27]OGH63039.1 MAG: hypothetical protein A3I06_16430 [Candidatus Lindowbacteria bacterium RIFCSPLOWO2_02_FULL_62_12]